MPSQILGSGPHALTGAVSQAPILSHDPSYLLSDGTFVFTFVADAVDGRRFLLSKDSGGFDNGGHAGVYIEDGKVVARFQDMSTTYVVETNALIAAGQTHHVAVSFGSGGLTIYVDGVEQASDAYTGGLTGNSEPIVIGANQWASGDGTADNLRDGFDGAISEAALYDAPLDAAEIASLSAAALNTAPVAVDDALNTVSDTPLSIDVAAELLFNDSDLNGDALSLASFTQPMNGALVDEGNGVLTYTPNAGFVGDDSFTYTLSDGNGGTATATATIAVSPPPLPTPLFASGPHALTGAVAQAPILAHDPSYMLSDGTFAFTFMADAVSGRKFLLSKDSGGFDAGGHAGIYIEDGKVVARFQDATTTYVAETSALIAVGQTHHVAVSFGAGGLKVFVDGVEQASNAYTGGLIGNAEPIVLGANQWASGDGVADKLRDGFDGALTEAELYDAALTAAEITTLSDDALGGGAPDPTGDPDAPPADDDPVVDDGPPTDDDPISAPPTPLFASGPHALTGAVAQAPILAHDPSYLLSDGTFAFTFTADAVSGRKFLLSKDSGGFDAGGHAGIYIEDGKIVARFQDATTTYVAETSALIAVGQTHHVAVSFGAGGLKVFVDGVEQASNAYTGGLIGNAEPIVLGANQWASGDGVADRLRDGFDGALTEAELYDAALTAAEIIALSAAALGGGGAPDPTGDPDTPPGPDDSNPFGAISDDFAGGALDPAWSFSGGAGAAALGSAGDENYLAITSPAGVAVSASDFLTTPRVLQAAENTDFQVSAGFLTEPSQTFSEHGLLIVEDDQNFIRFDIAFTSNGILRLIVAVVDNGDTDFELFQSIQPGSVTDFRITRTGDQFVFETSVDGQSWTPAHATTHAMSVTQVGVFAGSAEKDGVIPGYTAQVDYFENSAVPILNEDGQGAPANADPTADDDALAATIDTPLTINAAADLFANDGDPDGDTLSLAGFTQPTSGAIVENGDGTLTYTPNAGFSGTDSFAYTVSDGRGGSATATAVITVAAAPPPPPSPTPAAGPVLLAGPHSFDNDVANAVILAHDDDYLLERGTFAFTFVADDVNGLHYLLSKDSSGFDTGGHVGVYIEDGAVGFRIQDTATTYIAETAPLITAGQTHHVAVTFGAAGGMTIYVDGVAQATAAYAGGLIGNAQPIALGANQWKSANFVANVLEHPFDGYIQAVELHDTVLSEAEIADLSAAVAPINLATGAPLPMGDQLTAVLDTPLEISVAQDLLANDADPDGDALTYVGVAAPRYGALVDNGDGTLTYTPPVGYLGNDYFTYTVSDGVETRTATVFTTVLAEPPAPPSLGGGSPDWQYVTSVDGGLPIAETPENTAAQVLDVDKDGLTDFVIAGRKGGPAMTWYRQTPDGDFEAITIESEALRIEAGGTVFDVDGDGDLDIFMGGDSLSNEVWWWENPYPVFDPTLDWTRHTVKSSGLNQHHDMIFGDFDGDGAEEFVFWNQRGDPRGLYISEVPDDPTAGEWDRALVTGTRREGLTKGDVDGDGIDDIITGGHWYKWNGGTDFTEHVIDPSFDQGQVAAGDFNEDGLLDVVLTSGDLSGPLLLYTQTGDPTVNSNWVATDLLGFVSDQVHSVEVADIDQDGHLDIFAAEMNLRNENPDALTWVFFGDGTGSFETTIVASGVGHHESTLADLDGDGDLDILGKSFENAELHIWYNTLNEITLGGWNRSVIDDARPERAIFEEHADIDGDGLLDIVTGAWWYKNPGAIDGDWQRHTIGGTLNNMAAVYDFDGDGHLDILGTEGVGSTPNSNFVWAKNDGAGNFTIFDNIDSGVGNFLQGVTVAEFTPGITTVALSWQNGTGGTQALTLPADPTTGTWTWSQLSPVSAGEGLDNGDLDGDGDLDLLLGFKWLRNDPGGWTEFDLHLPPGLAEPDRVHLVDMDGDSDLDAVVGFGHEASITTLAWYEQPDDETQIWTEHVITNGLLGNPQSVDVGDLDGDGDIDVVAGEHIPGDPGDNLGLYVFENADGVGGDWTQYEVFVGDEHHDGAQLADFDNDGDLDIYSIGWNHGRVAIYENLSNGFDDLIA